MRSIGFNKRSFQFIDDGDDCGIIVERENYSRVLQTLDDYFLKLGFEMTVEDPVYVLEKVVFCQSQPVWTPNGYVMVRQLTALSKDLLTTKPHYLVNKIGYDSLRKSIGDGGAKCYGNIPIYCSFYEMMRRGVERYRELDVDDRFGYRSWMKSMADRSGEEVHPQTRASFFRAFDIIPDMQTALERHYDQHNMEWKQPPLSEHCRTRVHL
jgi:hypothetical protein